MSSHMLVRAWEVEGLTPAERLVLLALADCADREGRNAFRSESTIAAHTQLSLRTVKRGLQSLKLKGLVAVQELPRQRRATTYRVFPVSGANVSPLRNSSAVTLGVTNQPLRGDTAGVATLDPLLDPVDPGRLLTLFKNAVLDQLDQRQGKETDRATLLRGLTEWCGRREGLRGRLTAETAGQAIELALAERQQRPARKAGRG